MAVLAVALGIFPVLQARHRCQLRTGLPHAFEIIVQPLRRLQPLALAFVAALGAGIENAILAISLTAWPPYARIARAETLTIRKADYIAAIQLQGAGAMRIITGHIWPLCMSSIIIRMTLDMAGVILTAAGLGYLGMGAQPPQPEWGTLIAENRDLILSAPWTVTFPGLAILLTVLAINLMGDGMRDALDPTLNK